MFHCSHLAASSLRLLSFVLRPEEASRSARSCASRGAGRPPSRQPGFRFLGQSLVLLALVGACSRSTNEPVAELEQGAQNVPEWSEPQEEAPLGDDPQSQYERLVLEHEQAMQDFRSVYEKATTDNERQTAFEEKYPDNEAFASRFLQLAQQNRRTDAARQALIWVVEYAQGHETVDLALAQLSEDHVEDSDMFAVCRSLARKTTTAQARHFLQALATSNPDERTRGVACFSLAQQLKSLGEMKAMMADEAGRQRLQQFTSPEEFAFLEQLDLAANDQQVVELFERVKREFASVELASGRKLADLADAELFEIQHLAIGKEAPDIEGVDAEGESFKLSDYRGSIVLLDFWGDW